MRGLLIATSAVLGVAVPVAAQVAAPPGPAQAPAPTLSQIGMFIYPAKGQTKEQQAADEAACTEWAEAQTGLELKAGSVNTEAAAKAAKQEAGKATEGAAVVGAAKGAVAGTAIGAIAGDTGKGAAIGAVAGAMGGMRARRQAKKQAEKQGAQAAQAQNQQALDSFKKAAGACLEGRGYTVK
jgi:Glycine-zipper domain